MVRAGRSRRGHPGRVNGRRWRPTVLARDGHGRAADQRLGAARDTVRPGGLLLAVYHDLDDHHHEHLKSRGIDPADYVGATDLLPLLADDFTIDRHAVEPRIDPPPDTPHIADVVVRARRRSSSGVRPPA